MAADELALQERGREALVLERGEIGRAWAHERWDSLLVGSGNQSVRFPGREYDGDDPYGCPSGPELARALRRYVAERGLRVRQHTAVREVECPPDASDRDEVRFRTHLSEGGVIGSRNLVAAVGGYAAPRTPALAADVDPAVHQIHSRDYRNPGALPDGAGPARPARHRRERQGPATSTSAPWPRGASPWSAPCARRTAAGSCSRTTWSPRRRGPRGRSGGPST